MKILLIILVIATGQVFGLSVYNGNPNLGSFTNMNCIFQNSENQSIPNLVAFSSPIMSGIRMSDSIPFDINTCSFFSKYEKFYQEFSNGKSPPLLTNYKSELGLIPVYYEAKINLKTGQSTTTSCSGSLFMLDYLGKESLFNQNNNLGILTAKHCIKPLNVNINDYPTISFLKEGIGGNIIQKIKVTGLEEPKNQEQDVALIKMDNAELLLVAKETNSSFKNFRAQIDANRATINTILIDKKNNKPIQLFLFGGKNYYIRNAKAMTGDTAHAVSSAYLFAKNNQLIFKASQKQLNSLGLYTKIDENQKLLFCEGDAGGSVIGFEPATNKYLLLGMLLGGSGEFVDNKHCSALVNVLPLTNVFIKELPNIISYSDDNVPICTMQQCNIF